MSDPGTHEGTASPFRGSRLRAGVREAFLEEDEGDGSSARMLQRPFGISRDAVRQQDSCPIVTCRPRLALEAGPRAQQHGGGGGGGRELPLTGAAAHRGPAWLRRKLLRVPQAAMTAEPQVSLARLACSGPGPQGGSAKAPFPSPWPCVGARG